MYSRAMINEYADILEIPKEFISRSIEPYTIGISLFGSAGLTGYPDVRISVNNQMLFEGTANGFSDLMFDIVPTQARQVLKIELLNKQDNDTVIKDGTITADKYIQINKICLDHIDLDPRKYFRYKPQYPQGYLNAVGAADPIVYTDFMAFNGTVAVYYECPVLQHLAKRYYESSAFVGQKENATVTSFKKLANLYSTMKT